MNPRKILYINLGDNVPYTYDKIAGRVLYWASKNNKITLLVPELSASNIFKEIFEKAPNNIRLLKSPYSNKVAISTLSIVFSYLLRIIFAPFILFDRKSDFDIAISNSAFFVDIFPVLILKLFYRCKHWVLIMDSVVPSPEMRSGNKLINVLTYYESLIVGKIANRFSDKILTVNAELKKELISRGIDSKKIASTKNGLFINNIASAKQNQKFKSDAVYQGRISPNKGVDDLLYVWKEVVRQKPKSRLVIMGTGLKQHTSHLEQLLRKLNIENSVRYLGFTPNPTKYEIMKSSKLFLYLSKVNADESWGISLMEALSCGLPAISYDLPIYENIYHTESLIRVSNGDIGLVAKKIIGLLDNPKLRNDLSSKSQTFSSQFDWDNIAKKDLRLLNAIMKDENNHQN
ncbi:MAG: Glycosyltransferase [Candidatus Collierbacteria bacterium GW2011_GWB1_45_35]|uniref:Glycosyltransferase n=2 Tax=Candidatus Collieribacteriota TaxID=1752725 RepID=A0A0G1N135_9BACT|nr:MAG: Glycosyltransferase [Microgenomates group bacterium GW2011_GWC1_44_23]KKT86762.1 MAG: Glycosyltransferase [Candidatus Collierbacteria bacterium GW2011_GWA2_44_99]KKT95942.1 MAG: Glycosyltransferase [Candidatus Collierbacteria bacterium GW2011_GWA1_45_15]KKU00954.1 MAG: Glycosyltransferase [Candidatus Collierbacteria bacterium GW2011_GWB2_45_17]KKU05953.1 MAG: Glycosyltransferase [Candidatus Collierbacteria bacterium GW2011_GWB1_45_35]KKU08607.1 MAG: Glycosyltransferase [Candidatus Coll